MILLSKYKDRAEPILKCFLKAANLIENEYFYDMIAATW